MSVKGRVKSTLNKKVIIIMLIMQLIGVISVQVTILNVNMEEAIKSTREYLYDVVNRASETVRSDINYEQIIDLDVRRLGELMGSYGNGGENIDSWLADGPDEYFEMTYLGMYSIRQLSNIKSLCLYKAVVDDNGELLNDLFVVMDFEDGDEAKHDLGYELGETSLFDVIKKVYETGETLVEEGKTYTNSGISFYAVAPVEYSDGSVAGVAIAEKTFRQILLEVVQHHSIVLIVSAVSLILFSLAVILFMKISIVNPVNILSKYIREFVADENALTYKPITEIHTNDELQGIADDFNSLAQRVIDYTRNLEVKTSEEERLRIDLDVASQIRGTVSTETTYPAFPERTDMDLCSSLKHTTFNRCSYSNYFFSDTNRICILFGESLGDDLASMIFSILAVTYIKSFTKMGFSPSKAAFEVNNQLCSIAKKDRGLTSAVVIAEIDLKTGIMKYVNAGMPPLLIKRAGEEFMLDKANVPFNLGQMRGISFEENTIRLTQGNTVMFTSFGVSQMSDENGSVYTMERLVNTVNSISGEVYALDETISRLEAELDRFRGSAPVTRDTAIVGFRYFG